MEQTLMILVIYATIIEVALTPLRQWRPLRSLFAGRGNLHPITLVLIFLILHNFGVDLVASLVNAAGGSTASTPGTELLSGLLVVFSSEGVGRFFHRVIGKAG
jgi:hypothetical protein